MNDLIINTLKKRREFLQVSKKGTTKFRRSLGLQIAKQIDQGDKQHQIRLGYTASRKVGSAVIRNRCKRRLRALAKEYLSDDRLQGYDFVLIATRSTQNCPYSLLQNDIKRLIYDYFNK